MLDLHYKSRLVQSDHQNTSRSHARVSKICKASYRKAFSLLWRFGGGELSDGELTLDWPFELELPFEPALPLGGTLQLSQRFSFSTGLLCDLSRFKLAKFFSMTSCGFGCLVFDACEPRFS